MAWRCQTAQTGQRTRPVPSLGIAGAALRPQVRGPVHPYDTTLGCCRMEAYVRSGKRLKGMEVADCANGPHELRGVVRNELQSALVSRLPKGAIRFNAGIAGVSHFDNGERAIPCATPTWEFGKALH